MRSRGHFSVGVERKHIRFALLRANDLPVPLLRCERLSEMIFTEADAIWVRVV